MNPRFRIFAIFSTLLLCFCGNLNAQRLGPRIRYGSKVPADVKVVYERGLQFLVQSQQDNGSWGAVASSRGGENGITFARSGFVQQ